MPPGSAPPTAKKAATPTSKAAAAKPAAAAGTPSLWSAKEEAALKAAAAKLGQETPNRWERIAQAVGGGKTKDACKKHFKELSK